MVKPAGPHHLPKSAESSNALNIFSADAAIYLSDVNAFIFHPFFCEIDI
jgi:hypothetical protein